MLGGYERRSSAATLVKVQCGSGKFTGSSALPRSKQLVGSPAMVGSLAKHGVRAGRFCALHSVQILRLGFVAPLLTWRLPRPNPTFERTPNMWAPFHSAHMFSAAQLNVRPSQFVGLKK